MSIRTAVQVLKSFGYEVTKSGGTSWMPQKHYDVSLSPTMVKCMSNLEVIRRAYVLKTNYEQIMMALS